MNQWTMKRFGDMVDANAEKYSSKIALTGNGQSYSYAELKTYSERIAYRLVESKVTRGANIGLWIPNRPEWVFIALACARIGAVVVNLNTRFKTSELKYILENSDVKAIFFQNQLLKVDFEGMIKELIPSIINNKYGMWHEDSFPKMSLAVELGNSTLEGIVPLNEWLEKPLTAQEIGLLREKENDTRASDVANIFYTSGTTSFSKGAMQQQQSLLFHSYEAGRRLKMESNDKVLLTVPFCGVYGFNCMLATLSHGALGIMMDVFDVEKAVEIIENEQITILPMIDQMFNAVTGYIGDSLGKLSSVRTVCLAFLESDPRTVIEGIEKELSLRIIQAYGMSEGNSMVLVGCLDDPLDLRVKVGGLPVGATVAKVIDVLTGERLGIGKTGELCLKGVNITLGYYKSPDATNKAIDEEGWFHTGDLAEEGENGYFYFLGRTKDILKLNGFTVSPAEIEFYISKHPAVQLCQVIGIPNGHGGEVTIVCIIPKNHEITEQEIISFCKRGMASFKVPKRVVFLESFPVAEGPHGNKVQKNKLRDLIANMLNPV